MKNTDKAVLTIATGKPIYIKMAINLARSFKWWHKNSNIRFILATDQIDRLPSDLKDIEIVELKTGQYGHGFSPKLYLDKLSTAEKTLFIDADCLCSSSLDLVFDRFLGHGVSVVGKTIKDGDFFGDVKSICSRFNLESLPYFVGGVYYFEKGEISTKVYETARSLESSYDEIGLVRLRGRPNEEPLMSIAMALNGQTPILEDGTIKAEPMFYPSGMYINVIKGNSTLTNSLEHPLHCPTWGLTQATPAIIHFHCSNAERAPYTSESLKLEKILKEKWNPQAASLFAYVKLLLPQRITDFLRNAFRPLYRAIFGTRNIRTSKRVITLDEG